MTVIPDKHTLTIGQGATFFEVLTLYETMNQSSPRDLTDFSAEMIIRDKPKSENTYLTLATTNNPAPSDDGCSITLQRDDALGRIELKISAEATAIIPWKSAVYDLTITDTQNGVTDALLYGGIKVNGV